MMNLVQNYEFEDLGMKQPKRSTGELISSVTFFGAAIWLGYEAKDFMSEGDVLKSSAVYLGAFLSLLAAIRFTIQRLVHRVSEAIWPK
jgi:hypothetical protein